MLLGFQYLNTMLTSDIYKYQFISINITTNIENHHLKCSTKREAAMFMEQQANYTGVALLMLAELLAVHLRGHL